MLRIIVRTDDATMAANVGGPVWSGFETFEIEAPAVEAFLRVRLPQLVQRQVVGVELVNPARPETAPGHTDLMISPEAIDEVIANAPAKDGSDAV